MDREPEDLQFLGIAGIVGEAFKILRSFAKLLGVLTLTLILPLCFAILGHHLVSKYLLNEIHWNEMFYQVEAGTPAGKRTMRELTWEWTELFVFLATYEVFVFAFSLLSTAAVVYTVASIYTGKEISYGRVLGVVPRVWKRLMVTFFWFFSIGFAYYVAFAAVFALLIITVRLNNLNSALFIFGLILITAVFLCGYVYITMVWHLACVISVLEDKYGLGAMRKSKDLIKGNRITALVLDILYLIFAGIIGWFFGYAVLHGHRRGVGSAGKGSYGTVLVGLLSGIIGWFFGYAVLHGHRRGVGSAGKGSYGTVLVGLLCFVHLMGLLTQSVFYFVCKSYHHESIDKSSLSDHLEVYLGDYEPLKSSNIQMEDLQASV